MTSLSRRLASLSLAAGLTLAGCELSGTDEPEVRRWTGVVGDLRVHWEAEPGIDLLSGVAVPVRAYLESYELAQFTGDAGDYYPGFTRAVPPDEPDAADPSVWDRRPALEHPVRTALVGTIRFHISSVQPSDRNVAVTVCHYNYGAAEQLGNGAYASLVAGAAAPGTGIYAVRVTLLAPDSESALPPQNGPAAAPSNDVFGEWQISGRLTSSSTSSRAQWPTYEADRATCIDKAPDSFDRREFLLTGEHPRTDFPTSPPTPGWPDAPSQ